MKFCNKNCLFDELYGLYKNLVYGISLKILQDEKYAEDCFQEAFLRIYVNIKLFHGRNLEDKSTKNLVSIITRNVAIDLFRKLHRQQSRETLLEEIDLNRGINFDIADDFGGLKKYGECLNAESMHLLILYYYFDFSCKEIGKIMNLTPNNVKTKLYRIRLKIKEQGGVSFYEV